MLWSLKSAAWRSSNSNSSSIEPSLAATFNVNKVVDQDEFTDACGYTFRSSFGNDIKDRRYLQRITASASWLNVPRHAGSLSDLSWSGLRLPLATTSCRSEDASKAFSDRPSLLSSRLASGPRWKLSAASFARFAARRSSILIPICCSCVMHHSCRHKVPRVIPSA